MRRGVSQVCNSSIPKQKQGAKLTYGKFCSGVRYLAEANLGICCKSPSQASTCAMVKMVATTFDLQQKRFCKEVSPLGVRVRIDASDLVP